MQRICWMPQGMRSSGPSRSSTRKPERGRAIQVPLEGADGSLSAPEPNSALPRMLELTLLFSGLVLAGRSNAYGRARGGRALRCRLFAGAGGAPDRGGVYSCSCSCLRLCRIELDRPASRMAVFAKRECSPGAFNRPAGVGQRCGNWLGSACWRRSCFCPCSTGVASYPQFWWRPGAWLSAQGWRCWLSFVALAGRWK